MVTRKQQGEFHTTRPHEYKIEPLNLPKPVGRSYTPDEKEIVERIKKLDAEQRQLARLIKDKENLFRQRLSKKIGSLEHNDEIIKQYKKIDSLANSYSVRKHDKRLAMVFLSQTIAANNMELKSKRR
jgi:ribosomal protein L29